MTRLFLICITLMLAACSSEEPQVQEAGVKHEASERQILMNHTSQINKRFTEEDLENIEVYLQNKNWDIDSTHSGIFYYIFEQHDSVRPKTEDFVLVDYEVSTLEGAVLYSSEESGPTGFSVNKEDMESGVHEAVSMLGVGDEGIFIMVNNRAHGVLGDDDKIEPYQVLMYKLKLLEIK